MRILQICSARELGGGEKHVADLSNSLARRDHDVHVVVVPYSPLPGELSDVPAQNILELPMRNSLNIVSAFKLARVIKQRQIEIVHAHVARDYPLAALAAGRAGGAQLLVTRHALFPLNKSHRLTLRNVAAVIAVSQAVANRLHARHIFDRQKIVVIPNGIDIEHFARGREAAKRSSDRLLAGMVGHLAPIKGQKEFIRAAAKVCKSRDDVDFLIVGEDKTRTGENRQRIEKLIKDLGLGERVRLAGWVEDVPGLLATLDLLVCPSRSEPFGLSMVEAMAAGIPVVATMSEGAQEIIEADQTGRLVPIRDSMALAVAIDELLSNKKERQRLSANAQRTVRERFSLERMVDETEQLYRAVVTTRGGRWSQPYFAK
jgi:L-malate glycosyltransferase